MEKATIVLESFPPGRVTAGVSEISRRCGLAKSTTHRILQILEAIGMVEREESGYRLGARVRQLADVAEGRSPSQLRDCVLPYMLDLYEETHLTIHLGVWSGASVLIMENLHSRSNGRIPPSVGSRVPMHCTALGKVLLAYADEQTKRRVIRGLLPPFTRETIASVKELQQELDTIRANGLAVSLSGLRPGIVFVAAPIWGPGRSVLASISVAGPEDRIDITVASRRIRKIAHAVSSSQCPSEKTTQSPLQENRPSQVQFGLKERL